jgi:hypothetical protein
VELCNGYFAIRLFQLPASVHPTHHAVNELSRLNLTVLFVPIWLEVIAYAEINSEPRRDHF